MPANPRLDAGLLISTDHVLIGSQGDSLPQSLLQIQYPSCLVLKQRIPREDPTAVLPGFDRILMKPSPDRRAANLSNNPSAYHFRGNLTAAEPRQRDPLFPRKLASQSLHLDRHFRGENWVVAQNVADPPALADVPRQTSCATD